MSRDTVSPSSGGRINFPAPKCPKISSSVDFSRGSRKDPDALTLACSTWIRSVLYLRAKQQTGAAAILMSRRYRRQDPTYTSIKTN
jgi:hypothetical protein